MSSANDDAILGKVRRLSVPPPSTRKQTLTPDVEHVVRLADQAQRDGERITMRGLWSACREEYPDAMRGISLDTFRRRVLEITGRDGW